MKQNKRVFVQKKTHAYILPGIYGVGYAYTYGMTKVLPGVNFGSTEALTKNGAMHWYAWPDRRAEVSKQALRLAKNTPEYVFEIRKKFEHLVPELTNFTSAVF